MTGGTRAPGPMERSEAPLGGGCALFGVWGEADAAARCAAGLAALQHRGSGGAGVVSADGGRLWALRGGGRVEAALPERALAGLPGAAAIGQLRAAPIAAGEPALGEPLVVQDRDGPLALTLSGRLLNAARLRQAIEARGGLLATGSDAELILHLLAASTQSTFINRLIEALYKVEGAHCLLMLSADKMVVARDPIGFRPLVLGKRGAAWLVASEGAALEAVGAELVREVLPGEVILIDRSGLRALRPWPEAPRRACAQELLRFARPESHVFGHGVYALRRRLGERLAQEQPAEADLVLGAPGPGEVAALGYAAAAGLRIELGLRRRPLRPLDRGPGPKTIPARPFSVVRALVAGQRVALVDAGLWRGETGRQLVTALRAAGAVEVHVRVAAPPAIGACLYGVDTPAQAELLSHRAGIDGARLFLGADSLGFLSAEGLHAASGAASPSFCDACLSLRYPLQPQVEPERVQLTLFSAPAGAQSGA